MSRTRAQAGKLARTKGNAGFDPTKEPTGGLVNRIAIFAARCELHIHGVAPVPTDVDAACAQQCWHELNRRFPTEAM